MSQRLLVVVLAAAAVLFAGCATRQGEVVLLPDKSGRDTAVTVTQDGKSVTLDQPYAGAKLSSRGPRAYRSSAEQVDGQFAAALAAQPAPPQQFTLYFVNATAEFTPESQRALDRVLDEIARRPAPEVLIVGYTDTVGDDDFNDPLSLRRAEVVRQALIARGVDGQSIAVVGRGEHEPAVATADEVAEPRNRRVEILVR